MICILVDRLSLSMHESPLTIQGQEHQEHSSGKQRHITKSTPFCLSERDSETEGPVGAEVSV